VKGSRFICLFLLSGILAGPDVSLASGKEEPPGDSLSIDTAMIADYKQQLTARFYFLFQDASFVLNPGSSDILVYKPNVAGRIGITAFYRWYGIGLSMGIPYLRLDPDDYGKTSSLDLRINAYGNQFAAEIFAQYYKGFYIRSPEQPDGTKYTVPDMMMFSVGVNAYWIYNYKRFSIRAAFINNERQKKSAGSLIIRPTFLFYSISSSNGIIPPELAESEHIKEYEVLRTGNFYALGLAPGYSYTFVFLKNFYINGAVFPGIYWQNYSYQTTTHSHTDFEFSFLVGARIALGYNSDAWFIGASLITGINDVPSILGDSQFYYDVAQIRFWGGTRFDLFRKKKKN